MTRQEFLDNVTTFDELQEFCSDVDYYLQEDGAYSAGEYDDYIDNELYELAREEPWRDIRSWLSNLPDGYDYYFRDDWGDWEGRSYRDIYDLKQRVLAYADENDLFDVEDEETEEYVEEYDEADSEEEPEEDDFEDVEDCDMSDFIWAGNAALRELQEQSQKEESYIDQEMLGMLPQLVS